MSNIELQAHVSIEEDKQPRILILEDDRDIAEIMQQFFHEAGFSCRHELKVDDIVNLAQECKPDLILIDYLLPSVNGGELCSQLKADGSTKHIPVIICSAYPKVMLSLGTYGSDAFIAKPFDIDQLIGKVEQLINSTYNSTSK